MISDHTDHSILYSIVVLTHNRKSVLSDLLSQLAEITNPELEILVIDNGSNDGTAAFVSSKYPSFQLIRTEQNLGAVGRNRGIERARGDIVITIDDDILGIDQGYLEIIREKFVQNSQLGAICFKVLDFYTDKVCNWCHPKLPENFSNINFETNEITEGAVAFRRSMLTEVGLYPDSFFISHEGADLAARILNHNYQIEYVPDVVVHHKYAVGARPSWRRYYYDTRNDFWLVIRNYRCLYAVKYLAKRLPITFLYAVRDGFTGYWFKAVFDAVKAFPSVLAQRNPLTIEAQNKLYMLNIDKPGIIYFLKKRLLSKQVKI